MKPEVRAAVERLSTALWANPAKSVQADTEAMQVIVEELLELDALVVNLTRRLVSFENSRLFCGINIDAVHHSQQDRGHVHYLGGSGHSNSVPTP